MKHIYRIFKTQLLLVVMLLSAMLSFAQPVIQVPPLCNVVVAGTGVGTVTGPGGKVGNGGIVTMPDPFDKVSPDGDFTYVSNGTTLSSWKLYGDISKSTANVPPTAGIYLDGPTTPLNIESYNKILRFAETPVLPATIPDSKWARSKGRVEVRYSAPCGNNIIVFDIYKTYTNVAPSSVPIIIGPDCIKSNTTYTYSVDQTASDNANEAIGFDRYVWSGVPAGSTNVYNSADNSSITFTTPSQALLTSTTLFCAFGRANPWDTAGEFTAIIAGTTTTSKSIGLQPTTPSFITAPPSCLLTGTTSFNVAVTVVTGYAYSWATTGTSWLLVPSGTPLGSTVMVSNVDNNPGKLILTVTNTTSKGCLPVSFEYPINRDFKSPNVKISASSTCLIAGSTTNNFFVDGTASLNPTTWTLPVGWSITAGSANGTNSNINVTVPTTAAAGTYTITAKSNSCPGVISTTVFVKPAAPVFVATSPTCVTKGLVAIPAPGFSITPVAGVATTGYTWTYLIGTQPSGWTCTGNCNTVNPTVVPSGTVGGNVTGPVTVTVTATSGTGCSTSTTRTVNYNSVAPDALSAGCLSIGAAGTTTLTVANRPSPFYGTYTITSVLPAFVTSYAVNATTGVITLTTTAAAVAGTYSFIINHVTTSCGTSTSTLSAVFSDNGAVLSPGTIAGTTFDPILGNCDDYVINTLPVGATVGWFINGSTTALVANNTTILLSPSGNKLSLCGSGVAPTAVVARVTSTTGCVKILTAPLRGTHSSKQANPSGGSIKEVVEGISIYPNPSDGLFTIKVEKAHLLATATLTDASGKEIATYLLKKGDNKLEKQGIPAGVYTIVLEVDGKTESRQLLIK